MADWRRMFLRASRPNELLSFFRDFGLADEYLATALGGVSVRTIRRWLSQGLPGTQSATIWRTLDDLRAIIGNLLADGTYDRAGIVSWLCSRQADLNYGRPVDLLGKGEFEAVLALAQRITAPESADNRSLIKGSLGSEDPHSFDSETVEKDRQLEC
ncbi:MAG: hypothetical protein WBQ21_10765 [Solirubrobacteraceae bacterium]